MIYSNMQRDSYERGDKMLCQVHITKYTREERELFEYFFFHPYDKVEDRNGVLLMNYGGGKLCQGTNDFGEACTDCRYVPYFVREILRRETVFSFGK